MNNKYSFIVFNQLKEELNLRLLENYDEKQKYISTSKFCMKCTYESCENSLIIKFDALLRSKKAYCKTHRYNASGDKVSKTKLNSNKQIYDENRKKLLKLIEELNTELIGDYSSVNIKNDTNIYYKCVYHNCNENGTKQFHTLIKNKLAYCNEHHYLLHNAKINETLIKGNQERYNVILDSFKSKYPHINLYWDRNNIFSHAKLTFNCINNRCNIGVCKLFQHILQNEEFINEVFFGCDECKFYISEALREDKILLVNTPQYNELIEQPKQIDYITTGSSITLSWSCGNNCINCSKKHIYKSSPQYRFIHWKLDCPLCLEPNKCGCVKDGFICKKCKKYFGDTKKKITNQNLCKICQSSINDDNLELIFKRKLSNCSSICRKRKGNRSNMNLDLEYLQNLYQEQCGLCYISNMKMSLKVHSNFNISIERMDETNGYVKGNIQFICIEFQNGQQQWTPAKFKEFCNNYYSFQIITEKDKEDINKNYTEALIKNTKHTKKRKSPQKPYNNTEKQECLCRKCDTIKKYEYFSNYGIKNGKCKECHKIENDNNRNKPSLRLKICTLINGSKNGIEKRNQSKWRKSNPIIHTLTFEELLDIYLQQFGRCAYSNKLLNLSGEYMMSLERKDSSIGYTKDNCCLICIEFNTTDWSIVKCDDDNRVGSSGWNKEKLKSIVDNYLLNN